MTLTPAKTNWSLGLCKGLLILAWAVFALEATASVMLAADPQTRSLWGDWLLFWPQLIAALPMIWVALQQQGRLQLASLYLGLGVFAHGCADLVWAYIQRVLQTEPFPSLADLFYVASPVLLLIGVWYLFETPPNRRAMLKVNLEIDTLMVSVFLLCWHFFLARSVESFGSNWLPMLLSLFYPVMDLLILGLLLRVAVSPQGQKSSLAVLGGPLALILLMIADFRFNILSSTDSYTSGTPWDLGWSGAAVVLGTTAYFYFRRGDQGVAWIARLADQVAHFSNYFPYPAILLSYVLMIINHGGSTLLYFGSTLASAIVTLLVVTRQAVAFRENLRLTQELKALSHNLEQRVEERTHELEESQEKLVATEKLATIGRLTAGLAHEINTPLATSMNHLHQAQELAEEYRRSIGVEGVSAQDHLEIAGELQQSLNGVDASLERLGEFVRKMRSMGRNPSGNSVSFDPVKIINETLALLTPQAKNAGVELYFIPPSVSVSVYGESGRLSQVLTNLLGNAIHACEDRQDPLGSWVEVFLGNDQQFLTISVEDNGSGIPEEVQRKIFEPMFTTKEVGRGTGLGLSIIQDIVKGHFGGSIRFETELGVGTKFIVQIPLERTNAAGGGKREGGS